jgi:hypothetical protein
MCHQLAFWYKNLNLQIPVKAMSTGGIFLWKDEREVPDTMDALMVHPEGVMITWDSGFGNNQFRVSEDVLETDGTILRTEMEVQYRPQRVNRRGTPTRGEHGEQNFFACVESDKDPNCPFELGFRVAIASRMAVDSYRQECMTRWDPVMEEIV